MSLSPATDTTFLFNFDSVVVPTPEPEPARIDRGVLSPAELQYKALLAQLMSAYYKSQQANHRGTIDKRRYYIEHDGNANGMTLPMAKTEQRLPVAACASELYNIESGHVLRSDNIETESSPAKNTRKGKKRKRLHESLNQL
ncbi:hypothetical protein G7054_g14285 [Neopestalotiopsis clavispora]|nr:hypothetical protein G7054_g14285 [Neopestalotiopsis clavispora]